MAKKEKDEKPLDAKEAKLKALQAALGKIEKDFGKGSIMKLGDEKVEKVEKIMKGEEAPNSFIVQVEVKGVDGEPYTMQYDMTVVKENGKFKLSDSQIFD